MTSQSSPIKNFHPHSVTGKPDDSFIGLKIIGNEIHFYYPESYCFNLESSDVRKDVIDLLHTISLAKKGSKEFIQTYNTHNQDGEFALMSYLWVINDFLSNGFYTNRERIYKANQSGRVNWKRTLQSQPIVSNGNIIYRGLTVEIKNNIDNILVDIHKFCVKKSIDFIGWLFNLNSSFIEKKPYNDALKNQYLQTLQQELDKTFDDDKRLRLTHLKNIITGLDASDDRNGFVYGVDSYYYVFERMIDAIFGNVKSIKDFNPKATWQLVRNNYQEKPSSELRPDTIIIDGSTVFILDSKFYRFGFTGDENDLPETTSIQKQITYGDYIKKNVSKFNIDTVYNAFLIPYDKTRKLFKSDSNLQYIGFAKSTWKDNLHNHELVHTFLIDLKHVVKTWNRFNHKQDVERIINEIINHNKDVKLLLGNTNG